MASKIRIIGEFGEDVLDKVQAFVETLPGVQYVSLLVNGTETLPQSAPPVIDPAAPDAPVPPAVPEVPAPAPAPDAPPAA